MENTKNIFDTLRDEINIIASEKEKDSWLTVLDEMENRRVNLMIVGATGSGKSSTINALFDMSVAKVGVGVDPETKEIVKYDLENLTIWDTPGLGDGIKADKSHCKQIVKKLAEKDENGDLLIDLVLVVLDASSKDLSASYSLINNALIPCLGKDNANRILLALNQSDMAMKGRHWDSEKNEPEPRLVDFLTQKVESIKKRIQAATDITVEPIYYCAGYTDEDGTRQNPYNLSKLLYYILMALPAEKRSIFADKLNADDGNWADNDDEMDYSAAVQDTFLESLWSDITSGAEKGGIVGGCALGFPGMIAGCLVGSIIGGLHGLIIRPLTK